MKKFTILIALSLTLFVGVVAKAQSAYFVSTTTGKTLDTVTNAGARSQKLAVAGFQNVVALQINLAQLTGTAAGFVRVYGSEDGLSFVRIPTVVAGNTTAIDSMEVANNAVGLHKIFIIPVHAYTFYQVTFTGSGTQTTTLQTFAIWRKNSTGF